jgi:hypothetical protein
MRSEYRNLEWRQTRFRYALRATQSAFALDFKKAVPMHAIFAIFRIAARASLRTQMKVAARSPEVAVSLVIIPNPLSEWSF